MTVGASMKAFLVGWGLVLGAPAAALAAEPIEGPWLFEGGEVVVRASAAGSYVGTVTRATRFLTCAHPAGERMWEVEGEGTAYAGTHRWFTSTDCGGRGDGEATWRVRENSTGFFLDFCTAPPGLGAPAPSNGSTRCSVLKRAKTAPGTSPSDGSPADPGATPAPGDGDPTAPGADRPSPPQVCSGPACLVPPDAAVGTGCLRRGRFTHAFAFKLKRGEQRRVRVKLVRFALDWKPSGLARRAPYVAKIDGARLAAGPHLLRADVRLQSRRTRKTTVRRLSYRFDGCA